MSLDIFSQTSESQDSSNFNKLFVASKLKLEISQETQEFYLFLILVKNLVETL
jgi:hypothetical protein